MRYKTCAGYPSYIIYENGEVYRTMMRGTTFPTPRRIKQRKTRLGYMRIGLCENGIQVKLFTHRLLLDSFIPRPSEKHESSHLDGSRTNNNLSNLIWETRADNHARKKLHGTSQSGERSGVSKISNIDAKRIRHFVTIGIKQRTLGRCFGVTESCISGIVKRRTYADV